MTLKQLVCHWVKGSCCPYFTECLHGRWKKGGGVCDSPLCNRRFFRTIVFFVGLYFHRTTPWLYHSVEKLKMLPYSACSTVSEVRGRYHVRTKLGLGTVSDEFFFDVPHILFAYFKMPLYLLLYLSQCKRILTSKSSAFRVNQVNVLHLQRKRTYQPIVQDCNTSGTCLSLVRLRFN